ncbi:hypothetical protein AKJ16_DCAP01497 [Drosera capensis]
MGSQISYQIERRRSLSSERKVLVDLQNSCGCGFPGCQYLPLDRKNWMAGLDPGKLAVNKIVWPGTHDSATNKIACVGHIGSSTSGSRRIAGSCQRRESEIIILEIRTELGHQDPPEFEKYLVDELGDHLIHQDDQVFGKTVQELLPKRVICVWKPRCSPQPKAGGPLWSAGYLKDNWIDTDLSSTKFESNLHHLSEQPPVSTRKYFYRVENTVTPQADNPVLCVKPVSGRIRDYARLFITQCFSRGYSDRLQVFSVDFIDEDLVDACGGVTYARVAGQA